MMETKEYFMSATRAFLIALIVMLTANHAMAQAPTGFSYQVVVRDPGNQLIVNKKVSVKISLLKGSETGSSVYSELHQPTTNLNGLAGLVIGQGTDKTGVLSRVNWSNGPYFIKSEIDLAGGSNYSLSSVTQLQSVPYALYSNNGSGLFKSEYYLQYANTADYDKDFLVNTSATNYASADPLSKMMFLPSKKGAFRAGYGERAWDVTNVGDYSFASGRNTIASGVGATALGVNAKATGDNSFAALEGEAKGMNSMAIGSSISTSGVVIGDGNNAGGLILGNNNTGTGRVFGNNNSISTTEGFIVGDNNTGGKKSFIIGNNNVTGDRTLAPTIVIGEDITLKEKYVRFLALGFGLKDSKVLREIAEGGGGINNAMIANFQNYVFYTGLSSAAFNGVRLKSDGNSWELFSDSTHKENFVPAVNLLERIAKMKLGTWNYKGQDKTAYRHYGPMAQEFYTNFGHDGVGTIGSTTSIPTGDLMGVTLTAVQQLIWENQKIKEENQLLTLTTATLEKQLDQMAILKQENETLQKKVALIEQQMSDINELKTALGVKSTLQDRSHEVAVKKP